MSADLFAFAEKTPPVTAPKRRAVARPAREVMEGLRFTMRISDMITKARGKDDPGTALRVVREQLAAEGIDVSEHEIAAVTHRHWERVGMRKVPTFAEAMRHVAKFSWVPH